MAGRDDREIVHNLVLVFDAEREGYTHFLSVLAQTDLTAFADPDSTLEQHLTEIEAWRQQFLAGAEGSSLRR